MTLYAKSIFVRIWRSNEDHSSDAIWNFYDTPFSRAVLLTRLTDHRLPFFDIATGFPFDGVVTSLPFSDLWGAPEPGGALLCLALRFKMAALDFLISF
jgi:hypothetical protein